MFTYHLYPKQIEFYFKIKNAVIYYDNSEFIDINNIFYDPENPYGIGEEEYFRV